MKNSTSKFLDGMGVPQNVLTDDKEEYRSTYVVDRLIFNREGKLMHVNLTVGNDPNTRLIRDARIS
jgi:hypothetical protein